MQICSGRQHDQIINNRFNINTGAGSQLTINATPGGPSITPGGPPIISSKLPVPSCSSPCDVSKVPSSSSPGGVSTIASGSTPTALNMEDTMTGYKYITTAGDLSLNEYSPSQPEYKKLLHYQTSYFHDYYSEHYNKKLSPQQNILAFRHFESKHKVNLGINTKDEGHNEFIESNINNTAENVENTMLNGQNESENIENSILNIDNEAENIENRTINMKLTDTDSICKAKFKSLMDSHPELLKQSFNYALSMIPNNHNNNKIHPLSSLIAEPTMIDTFAGLVGGMPRSSSKSKSTSKELSLELSETEGLCS